MTLATDTLTVHPVPDRMVRTQDGREIVVYKLHTWLVKALKTITVHDEHDGFRVVKALRHVADSGELKTSTAKKAALFWGERNGLDKAEVSRIWYADADHQGPAVTAGTLWWMAERDGLRFDVDEAADRQMLAERDMAADLITGTVLA